MKAGDLKHRITLEKPVSVTDARGNRRTTWQTVATCMASMADVSGRDFYAAQAYQAQDIVRAVTQSLPDAPEDDANP